MKKILITGGAGFAGSNLALKFKAAFPGTTVLVLDNLMRRGSELALPRLKAAGIEFKHGDVRIKEDLLEIGAIDLLIDCAAEPSVMAGTSGSPNYVINTNLIGTINCLELARLQGAKIIFLSTSRVYPIAQLNSLKFTEGATRFNLDADQPCSGASAFGIAENFPLTGARSLYGSSKLCSEHLLEEYLETYKLQGVVNRCGVLTGPWQMGKVDQGVIVLWVAKHIFNKSLSYIGFGGHGKQVRDILHIHDLFELLLLQLKDFSKVSGKTYNVGGGLASSVSLTELTSLCQEFTKNVIPISQDPVTRSGDIISYLSDCRKVNKELGWQAKVKTPEIIEEITAWIKDNKVALEPILA